MKTTHHFSVHSICKARLVLPLWLAIASVCLTSSELRATAGYRAKAGKVAFQVGSNIPLVKVSGNSGAISGGGEATVAGNTASVHNLRFEVDPQTFKTGIALRDRHLYEKVFTAADGSLPRITLKAEQFQAKLDPQTSKWQGNLRGQLTLRGVTKPVTFQVTGEQKGNGAIVSAEGVLNTSDFGVEPISYSGATVDEQVTVTVTNLVVEP